MGYQAAKSIQKLQTGDTSPESIAHHFVERLTCKPIKQRIGRRMAKKPPTHTKYKHLGVTVLVLRSCKYRWIDILTLDDFEDFVWIWVMSKITTDIKVEDDQETDIKIILK